MEKNINMNELEELRGQMQMLRDKLDKQEIVNDEMVSRTVKSKMSWIRNYVYFEFIIIPFIALGWWTICQEYGLSIYNFVFLLVMVCIGIFLEYRINVASLNAGNSENRLTETIRRLVEMKQLRKKLFYIMNSLIVVWAVLTYLEINNQDVDSSRLIAMLIGGFIGLWIDITCYRKMQRTNNELIEQLKDISETEEKA